MKKEQGFTLIEVLVSLMLVGIMVVSFLRALTMSSQATRINRAHTTALNLAEGQLEHVRSQPYDSAGNPPQYTILPGVPDGYSVSFDATRLDPEGDGTGDDDGLQRIAVTVRHQNKPAASVTGYKLK